MIEVPVEACETEVEAPDLQPEGEVEAAAPEVALENPVPKKRGRPRKVQLPPPDEPTPVVKSKAKPKTRQRAPPPSPKPLQRVPEERYPQALGFGSFSSTELVAELLSRRASADRDRQRQMFRSWLV